MSNNSVKDWSEFQKLGELQKLENLLFVGMYATTTATLPQSLICDLCDRHQLTFKQQQKSYGAFICEIVTTAGNPLEEKHIAENDWREQALKRLPRLKKLDGVPVVGGDDEEEV